MFSMSILQDTLLVYNIILMISIYYTTHTHRLTSHQENPLKMHNNLIYSSTNSLLPFPIHVKNQSYASLLIF